MRKLNIFFVLIAATLFSKAQKVDTLWLTNNVNYGSRVKILKIDSAFILPYTGDTSTKNKGMMKFVDGRAFISTGTAWKDFGYSEENIEVNVKRFGAVGDGVTNDRPAISAAINYLAALGGGTVYIPHEMVCAIDTAIYWKSNVNLHLEGVLKNKRKAIDQDDDIAVDFTTIFLGNYQPSAYDTTSQQYNICDSIIGSKVYLKNIADTALYRKDTMVILRSMEAWYNGRNSFKPYYQTFALVDSVKGNIVYCDNDLGISLEKPALFGRCGNIKASADKKKDKFGVPYHAIHNVSIWGSGSLISEGSPPILLSTAYTVNIEGVLLEGLECISGNMMVKWNVNNIRFKVIKQLLELSINTNKSRFTNWVGEFVDKGYKVARQPIIRIGENSYNNLIANFKVISIVGGADSLSAIAIDDGWDNTIQGMYIVSNSMTNGVEIRTGHDSAHVYNNTIKDCEFHFLKDDVVKFFIDMNKEELSGPDVILKNNKFINLRFYGVPKNNAVRFDGDGNIVTDCFFENGDVVTTSTVISKGIMANNSMINPFITDSKILNIGNYSGSLISPQYIQNSTNNGFGFGALQNINTSVSSNVGIGNNALKSIVNSPNNIAVGSDALQAATEGPNVALGVRALYSNTTGSFNLGVGLEALYSNILGIKNTAIGRNALHDATGSGNIAIGNTAGDNITTGSNNITIGTDVTMPAPASASNYLNFANIIYGTGVNTSGSSASGGSIGINQTAPAYTLDVNGTGRYTGTLTIGNYILPTIDGTAGQYLTTNGVGAVSWGSASSPYLSGEVSGSNFTTTSTTATTITGLTVALEANKKYKVTVILNTGSSGTNGIVFGFSGPSGSVVSSGLIKGVNTSSSTSRVQKVANMNSLNANGFQNYTGTNGAVEITAIIAISSTSGNLNFQCASVNGAETSIIYIGSTIIAEKIN